MTNTTYKIEDLMTSFSFGEGESFRVQLLNSEEFKIMSGLYGKYTKAREPIMKALEWLFQDFDAEYLDEAKTLLKICSMPLDVKYHNNITIYNGDV